MKILVCIKEVIDSNLSLGFGYVSEALVQKGLPYRLNPNDAEALALALGLKEIAQDTQITAISIGPERVESYLTDALAMGANKAVRIPGEDLRKLSPYQKAKVLSRAISVLEADLVLTGARSLDNGSGQVAPLIAACLGLPCICEVVGFQLEDDKKSITVTRNVSKGLREKVQCKLPAVLTVTGQTGKLPYAYLDKMLESKDTGINRLSLSDLGISHMDMEDDPTEVTGLSFPRPRPRKVPTPDSSLPAFERILALLQGGISKRRGEILKGNSDELANQLFSLLLKENIIKTVGDRDQQGK